MPSESSNGKPISSEYLAQGVQRLLRGIAETLNMRERESTAVSPTSEMAYLDAERIRKACPDAK